LMPGSRQTPGAARTPPPAQANIGIMCFYRWMKGPSSEGQGFGERLLSFLQTDDGQRISICVFSIVATLALMAFEGGALAFVFGIPYMFFIPGFAIVRLFFWEKTSPEAKFVLSLGLSVVAMIFLGMALVLTPIGLDPNTTRLSLIVFAIGAVAVETLWRRGMKAPEATPEAKKAAETPPPPVKIDKVVAAMLATALVVSGLSLGLIVTAEYPSRTYFAMTGEDGKIITNVSRLINTTLVVNIEMKNGEGGPCSFTLVAYRTSAAGEEESRTFSRDMSEGDVWTETIEFWLNTTGYFRVDFDLYITKEGEPPFLYGNLHLWYGVALTFEDYLSETSSVPA